MKKYFSLLAALALICVLFAASCKQDSGDVPHTETDFLKGTWASANNGAYTFTINADLSFECVLIKITTMPASVNAKIKGNLDADASGLGPNDYILRNLETIEDAAYPENAIASAAFGSLNNIIVTLTPKENNTRFTFTSTNSTAHNFFGVDGDFVKKP